MRARSVGVHLFVPDRAWLSPTQYLQISAAEHDVGYFLLVRLLLPALIPANGLGLKNVGIVKNMTELKIIYSDAVRQSSKERLEMVWPSAVPLRGYEKNMRVLTRSKQVSVAMSGIATTIYSAMTAVLENHNLLVNYTKGHSTPPYLMATVHQPPATSQYSPAPHPPTHSLTHSPFCPRDKTWNVTQWPDYTAGNVILVRASGFYDIEKK